MRLTEEEIEEGAERLCRSSGFGVWRDLELGKRKGLRAVVRRLADQVKVERSPGALRAFMLWMGDDLEANGRESAT
jgi:hypothetical protein